MEGNEPMLGFFGPGESLVWDCVWQSCLFLGLGLAASAVTARRPARAHRLLILAGLAALATPLLSHLAHRGGWGWLGSEQGRAVGPIPVVSAPAVATSGLAPATSLAGSRRSDPAGRDVTGPPPASRRGGDPSAGPGPGSGVPWAAMVRWGWLIASGFVAVRLAGAFVGGWQMARSGRPVEDAGLEAAARMAAERMGVDPMPELRVSPRVRCPSIWCWGRRPLIVLPAIDPGRIDWVGVFCHELAHLVRRDHLAGLFAEILPCLLPWSPLAWMARRRLAALGELACDEWVLSVGVGAADYAESLLRLVPQRPAAVGLTAVSSRSGLKARVRNILEGRRSGPLVGGRWSLASAAAMVLAASAVALAQARPATTGDERVGPAGRAIAPAAATKAAGDPARYTGRVIAKGTGRPVAGATVTVTRFVFPEPATGGKRILQTTRHPTDTSGRFQFTTTPEQMAEPDLAVLLRVEHPDYPPEDQFEYDFRLVRRDDGQGDRALSDIELSPGRPVTGVVVTPEGRPATGVVVRASSFFAPETRPGGLVIASNSETRTDGEGRFRLVVVTPGEVHLTLSPDEYAIEVRKLEEGRRGDLGRFILRPGIALRGKVVDAEGGPLAGVIVNAAGFRKEPGKDDILDESTWDNMLGSASRTAVADERGEFAFAPLPPGVYRVLPVDRDRDPLDGGQFRPVPVPFAWRKVTLNDGETPAPIEIRALPSVVVEARIRDSGGRPKAGFSIALSGSPDLDPRKKRQPDPLGLPEVIGDAGGPEWRGQAWSDANGRIAVRAPRGLQSATLMLSAFEGYAERFQIGKSAPLRRGPMAVLGSLDRDVRDIEVVAYQSPTLVVRAVAADGSRINEAKVEAAYGQPRPPDADAAAPDADAAGFDIQNLAESEFLNLMFVPEDDGRFRSMGLLPDEVVTVTASADGYRPRSQTLKLAEGAVKELELILDKK
jgi:hypothetical protein